MSHFDTERFVKKTRKSLIFMYLQGRVHIFRCPAAVPLLSHTYWGTVNIVFITLTSISYSCPAFFQKKLSISDCAQLTEKLYHPLHLLSIVLSMQRSAEALSISTNIKQTLVRVRSGELHPSVGVDKWAKTILGVQSVSVAGREDPTPHPLQIGMGDDSFQKPFAQPTTAILTQNKHIAEICKRRLIGDDTRKANLPLAVKKAKTHRIFYRRPGLFGCTTPCPIRVIGQERLNHVKLETASVGIDFEFVLRN